MPAALYHLVALRPKIGCIASDLHAQRPLENPGTPFATFEANETCGVLVRPKLTLPRLPNDYLFDWVNLHFSKPSVCRLQQAIRYWQRNDT